MPDTQTQLRKGTTAQNNAFTGAVAEVTVDTTKWIAVVHDGVTAGGFPLAGTMFANVFSQTQSIASASIPRFQIFKADGTTKILDIGSDLNVFRQEADTTGTQIHHFKRGTTGDANAAVASGDQLSQDNFKGWDGAAYVNGAQLRVQTRELFTPIARGSEFQFFTVAVGATTLSLVATLNASQLLLGVPLDMGTHLINNVVNPVAAQDAATKSYVDGLISAGAPPFTDTTPLVKGSGDATKLLRFEVDGFTTATTRVLTPPNQNFTIAGLEVAQTFTVDQIFNTAITAGNTLFNVTATTGVLRLGNGTDPAADPTAATKQWAVGGEWQYRSSAASEGAGQTNRVHNRAEQTVGAGTNYTLTTTAARVDFGTTDPEVVLPTAGTYLVTAIVVFTADVASAADIHQARLQNSTDAVAIAGSTVVVTLGASFSGTVVSQTTITITASKTIQVWAFNVTSARGVVLAANTSIRYVRLY